MVVTQQTSIIQRRILKFTAPQTKAEFETNVKQFEAEMLLVDETPILLPDDGFDLVLPELKYTDVMEGDTLAARASALIEEQKQKPKNNDGLTLDELSKGRTNDKLRKNLMSKLTYEKIWLTPKEKPKQYETAIIFDWDDTLLCTTFINPSGVYHDIELNGTVQQHIKLLEITTK